VELKTNLTEEDYQDLLFCNFKSKKLDKLESISAIERIKNTKKTKLFKTTINGKEYDGVIESNPIVLDCYMGEKKEWKREVSAIFRIKIRLNIKDIKNLWKLETDLYVDDRRYYTVQEVSVYKNFINFEMISFKTFLSDKYIEI